MISVRRTSAYLVQPKTPTNRTVQQEKKDNKKPAEAGYFSSKPFQHPVGSIQAMVIIPDR